MAMNELLHLLIEKIEEQKSAGKFDRARVIVEEAIAQYPDDFHLYEELADILLYQNDVPSAKKAIEYAQSMQADSPTGLYLMGYANTLESNYPEAIRYLEKSNEWSPNNPEDWEIWAGRIRWHEKYEKVLFCSKEHSS